MMVGLRCRLVVVATVLAFGSVGVGMAALCAFPSSVVEGVLGGIPGGGDFHTAAEGHRIWASNPEPTPGFPLAVGSLGSPMGTPTDQAPDPAPLFAMGSLYGISADSVETIPRRWNDGVTWTYGDGVVPTSIEGEIHAEYPGEYEFGIPEPGTLVLTGLAALCFLRRNR